MLKELVPALARVAVLFPDPDDRNKSFEYKEVQVAAHSINLTLQAFNANSPSAIDAPFVRMASDQAQALMILADSFMNGHVLKLPTFA